MRKHFDNDGVRDKDCLILWIAGSNIQTGDGKYFFAGETFHIDYDVGGTDPSLTLSHALSRPALALREKDGVGNRAGESERERERERDGARH